jgi:hypothetical protein
MFTYTAFHSYISKKKVKSIDKQDKSLDMILNELKNIEVKQMPNYYSMNQKIKENDDENVSFYTELNEDEQDELDVKNYFLSSNLFVQETENISNYHDRPSQRDESNQQLNQTNINSDHNIYSVLGKVDLSILRSFFQVTIGYAIYFS